MIVTSVKILCMIIFAKDKKGISDCNQIIYTGDLNCLLVFDVDSRCFDYQLLNSSKESHPFQRDKRRP